MAPNTGKRKPGWLGRAVVLSIVGSGCMSENRVVALSGADATRGDDETTEEAGTGDDGEGTGDGGARFDLGSGALDPDLLRPQIPRNCVSAWKYPGSMGCSFYAVDLDQAGLNDHDPWGVVVINVQPDADAIVDVHVEVDGDWVAVVDEENLGPGQAHLYPLPDLHHQGSGVFDEAAYRIHADVPVTVLQVSPVAGGTSWRSGATLLHPLESWTPHNHVLGWRTQFEIGQPAYISVVAAVDATTVSVVPSMQTEAGVGLAAGQKGVQMQVSIGAGDVLQLAAKVDEIDPEDGLTGTIVSSGSEHPIAVFTAHACAGVPDVENNECGHMQEQLSMQLQGTEFAVARLPVHDPGDPEPMLIHLYALEDDTKIEFEPGDGTINVPLEGVTLDRGDSYKTHVTGLTATSGHFVVHADKPILVMAYTENPPPTELGGPSMVQLAPLGRWLADYHVYAPPGWDEQTIVIARPAGTPVTLDDVLLDDTLFEPFGEYEAAQVVVDVGVHHVVGKEPISLLVDGVRDLDGYAYLGGWAVPTPVFPPPK